jgi:hypothetical protein
MSNYDPIPAALMQKIRIMSHCDDVREIPGFPLYAITVTGQVWSIRPANYLSDIPSIPRQMKLKDANGSWTVNLRKNQKTYTMTLGKLMLMTFVSKPPCEDAQARFIDGDYRNLKPSNLKWVAVKPSQ